MPVRTSHTSASVAARLPASERTAADDVRVNRASALTASARPAPDAGPSTSLRNPAAPIDSERSAVSADRFAPSASRGVTRSSPAPWPAAAHTERRSVSSAPA